ncbi:MAG: hypothetical protein QW478_00275 [Candidatus Micrarchaeaceae archaeon]
MVVYAELINCFNTKYKYSTIEYTYNKKLNTLSIERTYYDEDQVSKIYGSGYIENDSLYVRFDDQKFHIHEILWTDYDNYAFIKGKNTYLILIKNKDMEVDKKFINTMLSQDNINIDDLYIYRCYI